MDIPVANRNPNIPNQKFTIVVDLCTIFYFLGSSGSKYTVSLICGPHNETLPKISPNLGLLPLNRRFAFVSEGVTVEDLPDIIISVKRDSKGCTYLRFRAADLLDPKSSEYQIESMKIDKATEDDLKDFQSGYLRYRIGVFSPGRSAPGDWIAPPSQPKLDRATVIVNLFAARNLPAGDDDGLSDPEALIYHFGAQGVSKVVRKTLDPTWSQRILLNSYSVNGVLFPLVLLVFDRDESLAKTKYELLGTALIPINQCRTEESKVGDIPNPKWYSLQNWSKQQMARVCLSVQVIPPPTTALTTLIQPLNTKRDLFKLKLYILGLRGLVSGGMFDVKNPYIKINVGSMKGTNSGFADLLTASSVLGGPDANFNNLISVDVQLPSSMSLMPALTCKVYDVARTGIGENYIGSFNIDLAKYAIATKLFFITRLTRLRRHLVEKRIRQDAIGPIDTIIDQMKQYLTSEEALSLEDEKDPKELQKRKQEMVMQISRIQDSQQDHQAAMEQLGLSARGAEGGMTGINAFQRNKEPQDRIRGLTQSQNLDQIDRPSTTVFLRDGNKQKVVIMAAYELDTHGKDDYTREKPGPPLPYIPLGHVSLKDPKKGRHYRLALDTPLEGTSYLSSGFFDKSAVFRGKAIPSDQSWLASIFVKEETYKEVGLFRGQVKLIEEKFLADVANLGLLRECNKLQLPGSVHEWDRNPTDKMLIAERTVRIFVYIVDVQIFVEKDVLSPPDPYLVLSLGGAKINDRSNKFIDTYNAKFYRNYE